MEKNALSLLKVRGRSSSMEITIVCVPFQVDVARWGCARGPQAFLDAGIVQQIEARGHSLRNVV
jgi:arginase family enzyme